MTLNVNAMMSNESDSTAFLVAPMPYERGQHAIDTFIPAFILGFVQLPMGLDQLRGLALGLRLLCCVIAAWLITGLHYRKRQTFRVDANGIAVEGGWSSTTRTYSWAELTGWHSERDYHRGFRLRLCFADGRTAYALYGIHDNWKRLCGRLEEILPATKKSGLFIPGAERFIDVDPDLFLGGAERLAKCR